MRFFEIVMEHAPALVFVKDQDSVFVYANRAVLALYAPDQRDRVIGSRATDLFPRHQSEKFLEEDQLALQAGSTDLVEEITDYLGQVHILHTRKTVFRDADGVTRILGISDDITQLVQRERELAEANARLMAFAASAAHDLKSPLGAYVATLEFLQQDRHSTLSDKAGRFVSQMIDSANGLSKGINVLLAISKMEAKPESIQFAECDLNLILNEVKFGLSRMIASRNARIYTDRLPVVWGEPNLIRLVLLNLIQNSIKYCPPLTNPEITIRHELLPDQVIINLEDNGCGVPPDARLRLLQPFEQMDGNDGCGLGLAICERAVKAQNATLSIEDGVRGGTKFTLRFARSESNRDAGPALEPETARSAEFSDGR